MDVCSTPGQLGADHRKEQRSLLISKLPARGETGRQETGTPLRYEL